MKKHILMFFLILFFTGLLIFAQGEKEAYTALKGAHIIPVVGEEIPGGTILIKGKLIEAIGKDILIPADARIVDGAGLYAYPGMIDSYCFLGLVEISSIPATIDYRETGRINPQVRSTEALRPDSMHIPITRSNGITAALVVPAGGLVAGQSGLIRLTGWTPAEMVIKSPVAMHVEFPSLGTRGFRREQAPQEEASKQVLEIKDWLNKARYYQKRKEAAAKSLVLQLPEFDEKLESLLPVVNGELPLTISVHADKDIRAEIAKVMVQSNIPLVGMKAEEFNLDQIYMKYFREG